MIVTKNTENNYFQMSSLIDYINVNQLDTSTFNRTSNYDGTTYQLMQNAFFIRQCLIKYGDAFLRVPETYGNTLDDAYTYLKTSFNDLFIDKEYDYLKIAVSMNVDYDPISNYDRTETHITEYSGTETNKRAYSGLEQNKTDYSGSETNERTYSGSESERTTYSGSESNTETVSGNKNTTHNTPLNRTETNYSNPYNDAVNSKETGHASINESPASEEITESSTSENTLSYDGRNDNVSRSFDNRKDTDVRTYGNRSDTNTKSFTNREDTDTRTFTNRQDQTSIRAYGNIGVTTNQEMIESEYHLRSRYSLFMLVLSDYYERNMVRLYIY